MLNEACSSGCGSFIETYAKSVDMPVEEFAKVGCCPEPGGSGNKMHGFHEFHGQAGPERRATIGDIAAGLSYSVIKNALYKVIKLRNPEDAGEKLLSRAERS